MKPSKEFTKKICSTIAIVTILFALFSVNAQAAYTSTAFPIPDSGQTKCSDMETEIPCPEPGDRFYGQDGNYLINPPSYTKLDENGNDLPDDAEHWVMVRDNVTGLIWEVKTDDGSIHDKDNKYSWYDSNQETNGGNAGRPGEGTDTEDFITTLNADNFGGYSDWRLPTVKEIASIVNMGRYYPAMEKTFFPHVMSAFYWSSTSSASNTGNAWGVYFYNGYDYSNAKDSSYFVRAVRGGQCRSFDSLVINGDETVTDMNTGLMWQRTSFEIKMNWQKALSNCENLSFAGYNDWRLPTREELRSIVNYINTKPAINKVVFPNTLSAFYWSSTSNANYTGLAWGVNFDYGSDNDFAKDSSYFVRAVRGGQCWLFDHLVIWSPNKGAIWNMNDKIPIIWDTKNISGNVNIYLSRQGGRDDTFDIIAENTINDGSYTWTATGEPSVNCVLKIEPINEPEKMNMQGLFTIKNPCFFTSIPDLYIGDTAKHELVFTCMGPENEMPELSAVSSNTELIPTENIHMSGEDLNYTLTFYPKDANQSGTTTITIEMVGQNCTSTDDIHITILPENDPPLIHLSELPFYTKENRALKLSEVDETWVSITDEDAADHPIQLTLCAINGVLKLTQTSSLTIISGKNNSDMICIEETIATINNSLKHIVFIPTTNYFGHAGIDIKTSDQGFSGSDGIKTDRALLHIYINPEKPCTSSFPIPDSGQTTCYNNYSKISCPQAGEEFYGQDATYSINTQSFSKLDSKGNDLPDSAENWTMVQDNVTGLIWEVKTDDAGIHDKYNTYTWYDSNPNTNAGRNGTSGDMTDTEDFITTLNAEKFGGYSDWRIPTVKELASIKSLEKFNPSINKNYFPHTMSAFYWSSTSYAYNTGGAWAVYFYYYHGGNLDLPKSGSSYVRAVRGGQCRSYDHLVINSDETVTDVNTGLMWQKKSFDFEMNWHMALSNCDSLSFAGYNDWRLPTKEELRSIVDYGKYEPAINRQIFSDTLSEFYWSSTSYDEDTGHTWAVDFGYGYVYFSFKGSSNYVRAVRGGQYRSFDHLVIWSPNQGSLWNINDNIPISWNPKDIPENVTIFMSFQGGKENTYEIIAENTENDGAFDWVATKSSVNCMLKIEPINDPSKSTRNGLFAIFNDPPVLSICSDITLTEDQSALLTQNLLTVTDSSSSPQEIQFKIITPPKFGTLARNSSPLTKNDTFTQADINATLLSYTHNGDEFATRDEFTFIASDGDLEISETSFVINIELIDEAPIINQIIQNIQLLEDSSEQLVDLSKIFTDIDNLDEDITISILNHSNPSLVTATLTDKILKLNFQNNQYGEAILTLLADSNGKSVTTLLTIEVESIDDPPMVVNPIKDVMVNEDAASMSIDVKDVFMDVDNDIQLSIQENTNPGLMTVAYSDYSITLNFIENQNGHAQITIRATGNNKTASDTFLVTVQSINDAPILSPVSYELSDISEDDTDNQELLWMYQLTDVIDDVDRFQNYGMAVFSCKGNGQWQYRHHTQSAWNSFGSISPDQAILLDINIDIRYIPDEKNGEHAWIQFYAWDQTSGTPTDLTDISDRGGTTPFSIDAGMLSITVTSINDAPKLNPQSPSLTITEDDIDNTGISIAQLLENSVSDPDSDALSGIAIKRWGGNNVWQYSIHGTQEWQTVPVDTQSEQAFLLGADDHIRYIPNGICGETASFQFYAWDQTNGLAAASIVSWDMLSDSNAFSKQSDTLYIDVKSLNDAPVLHITEQEIDTITEDDLFNPGVAISTFINENTVTDADENNETVSRGIAIYWFKGNGYLQYYADDKWILVGLVNQEKALLLNSNRKIRYIPDNKQGETAWFHFYAWDGTNEGQKVNISETGNTSHFSATNAIAKIKVTDLNDAPELKILDFQLAAINEDPVENFGNTLSEILGKDAISDKDGSPYTAIAVTGVQNTGGDWYYFIDGDYQDKDSWKLFTDFHGGFTGIADKAILLDASVSDILRIKFVPQKDFDGSAYFTFRAWDTSNKLISGNRADTTQNGNTTAFSAQEGTCHITVRPINDPPCINDISSLTILENSGEQEIALKGINTGAYYYEIEKLTITASTNNLTLINNLMVHYDDSDQNDVSDQTGKITFTPCMHTFGTAIIDVQVSDTENTIQRQFTVTVLEVNDPPEFQPGSPQTILEDAGRQFIPNWATHITAGPNENQNLKFYIELIERNNSDLFSESLTLTTDGTLIYTPEENQSGRYIYSIILQDDGSTVNGGQNRSDSETLTITVKEVNDPPVFRVQTDQIIVNEDCGKKIVAHWVTSFSPGPNESDQRDALTFQITDESVLFQSAPVIAMDKIRDGMLSFTPKPNVFGIADLTIVLNDHSGTDNGGSEKSEPQKLTIVIQSVNDAPVFAMPEHLTINEDAGPQAFDNWAADINKGAENERDQTIRFITTVQSIASEFSPFFLDPPKISPSGTLTFTTAKNACGTVTITVLLQDDGGVANGGMDKSEEKTFQLIVTPMKENKVIIVFGGPNTDPRYDTFKTVADLAYNTLMSITGYTEQNTLYVQPDSQATTSTIYSGINNWARDADSLLIYFIGHGDEGKFQLNTNEYLQATILSEWLDTIQETIQGRVIFIYDSCRSGSFIPVLMHKNRVLITSSGNNEDAFFENFGKDSFSYEFWSQIAAHHYFDFAYFYAKKAISENQTAHLEADGLTTTTYKEDNIVINNLCLGENHICTKPEKTPCVVKGKDSFEPDDNTIKKARFFSNEKECHNFYNIDGSQPDEDWIMIYAPDNKKVIEILNPGENCDPVIELYDIDNLDDVPSLILDDGFAGENERHEVQGSYYMKLRNYQLLNDDTSTTYQLNIYNESGSFSGTLSGCVINPFDPGYDSSCLCHSCGTPISEITVKIIDSDNEQYLKSKYNQTVGFYYKGGLDAEKTYLLSAIANGYTIFNKKIIINQLKEERLDIYMYPVKGDLTGDCIIDLNDLILSCQEIVDGLKETNLTLRSDYVTSGVDIDNDQRVGLAEVIYIMQQLKVVE
jgi:hypothetical protein